MGTLEADAGPEAVTPAEAVEDLYRRHYRSLVRLAALVLGDIQASEEVVQDAFVRVIRRWDRIEDETKAVSYLRSAVMNGARNRYRRRVLGRKLTLTIGVEAPAEAATVAHTERDRVLALIRRLPARQRDCLLLRFYMDMSEAEIATTLGISAGSVKTHASRALAELERTLPHDRDEEA